jgi:hypothetical protein
MTEYYDLPAYYMLVAEARARDLAPDPRPLMPAFTELPNRRQCGSWPKRPQGNRPGLGPASGHGDSELPEVEQIKNGKPASLRRFPDRLPHDTNGDEPGWCLFSKKELHHNLVVFLLAYPDLSS